LTINKNNGIVAPMNNFNNRGGGRGFDKPRGNFGGRPKFGGDRRGGGGRDRGDRPTEMFSAVCAECNKRCEVPFRPTGDKPVYCSDCFGRMNKEGGRDDRGGDRNNRREERRDFKNRPRDERPPRHEKSRGNDDGGLSDIKRQLATIESRLNRILDVLNPPTKPERTTVAPTQKAKKAKKEVNVPALQEALAEATKPAAPKVAAKKVAKKVTKKATKKSK